MVPSSVKPELFPEPPQKKITRKIMKRDSYLVLGIKVRIFADLMGWTQAKAAQKLGLDPIAYRKIEEAQHAPDCEKSFQLQEAGLHFTPYDARTRIPAELVALLFGRGLEERE